MHLVMRYLCFFGIVKRQGVKRRMDKRSTSEEQKSGYLGLTRADEERHLADVISVAQQNLERAGADIRKGGACKQQERAERYTENAFHNQALCFTMLRTVMFEIT